LLSALSFLIVIFLFTLWKVFVGNAFFFLLVSYGFLCFCVTLWVKV
jgi:hypothetical protein